MYKTLKLEHGEYRTTLTNKYINRKKYENKYSQINSVISGVVKRIKVKKGQKINIGDHLMSLNAMKMENVIKSNIKGVISDVCVSNGESVVKGQVLIKF